MIDFKIIILFFIAAIFLIERYHEKVRPRWRVLIVVAALVLMIVFRNRNEFRVGMMFVVAYIILREIYQQRGGFIEGIQNGIFEFLAKGLTYSPRILDFLVWARKPEYAANLYLRRFDRFAPLNERTASTRYEFRKWSFFDAAKFLVDCKAMTIAGIIHQLYTNENLTGTPLMPPNKAKVNILTTMMLTIPFIVNPNKEKLVEVLGTLAGSTPGLMQTYLENLPVPAALFILQNVGAPPLFMAFGFLEPRQILYYLEKLLEKEIQSKGPEEEKPDFERLDDMSTRAGFLFVKLPVNKADEVEKLKIDRDKERRMGIRRPEKKESLAELQNLMEQLLAVVAGLYGEEAEKRLRRVLEDLKKGKPPAAKPAAEAPEEAPGYAADEAGEEAEEGEAEGAEGEEGGDEEGVGAEEGGGEEGGGEE